MTRISNNRDHAGLAVADAPLASDQSHILIAKQPPIGNVGGATRPPTGSADHDPKIRLDAIDSVHRMFIIPALTMRWLHHGRAA